MYEKKTLEFSYLFMHLICLTVKNNPASYLVGKGRFGAPKNYSFYVSIC